MVNRAAGSSLCTGRQTETASSGCRSAQQHSTHRQPAHCTLTTLNPIHPWSSQHPPLLLHPPLCKSCVRKHHPVNQLIVVKREPATPSSSSEKPLYQVNGNGHNKHQFHNLNSFMISSVSHLLECTSLLIAKHNPFPNEKPQIWLNSELVPEFQDLSQTPVPPNFPVWDEIWINTNFWDSCIIDCLTKTSSPSSRARWNSNTIEW